MTMIEENADYGFDQTHHSGHGRRGDRDGRSGARVCSAVGTRRSCRALLWKGAVRIHYEEAGSGFPLLLIAGGGLNSTISALARAPFNPIEEFKGEYRCIAADLRNAVRY
jgi:hypothetical protein